MHDHALDRCDGGWLVWAPAARARPWLSNDRVAPTLLDNQQALTWVSYGVVGWTGPTTQRK